MKWMNYISSIKVVNWNLCLWVWWSDFIINERRLRLSSFSSAFFSRSCCSIFFVFFFVWFFELKICLLLCFVLLFLKNLIWWNCIVLFVIIWFFYSAVGDIDLIRCRRRSGVMLMLWCFWVLFFCIFVWVWM